MEPVFRLTWKPLMSLSQPSKFPLRRAATTNSRWIGLAVIDAPLNDGVAHDANAGACW